MDSTADLRSRYCRPIGNHPCKYVSGRSLRALLTLLIAVSFASGIPASLVAAGGQTGVSGEAGIYGERNSISGREKRRPDGVGRLFLRPVITFGNGSQIQFDFELSTEGSSARQDINNFGFSPRWRWGELYLGDFSLSFSPLTLDGVRIRGGGFSLHPGKVRLTVLSGLSQRRVSNPAANRAYRRTLSGVQMGIGRESGTSFTLNVLTIKDDVSSLADLPVDTSAALDTTTMIDSTTGDTLVNPLSVTPQENLVVSAMTNLSTANNQLLLKTEVSGSAITRDRRSAVLESSDVPNALTHLFTPRVSSSADYAYTTEVQLNRRAFGVQAGYDYIGPGYVSLGLASNIPDRRTARLGFRYRMRSARLRLNYRRQSNNLIGQKASTTLRNQLTGGLSMRMTRSWTMNLNSAYITMNNHLSDTLSRVDNVNYLFRVSQLFNPNRSPLVQTVQFDYAIQGTNEKNPSRSDTDLKSHEVTFRLTSKVRSDFTLTPSTSVITTKRGQSGWSTTLTLGLNGLWTDLIKRRSVNARASYTGLAGTKVIRFDLRGDYRLLPRISSRLQLLSTFARTPDKTDNYNEFSGRLTLAYHFGE